MAVLFFLGADQIADIDIGVGTAHYFGAGGGQTPLFFGTASPCPSGDRDSADYGLTGSLQFCATLGASNTINFIATTSCQPGGQPYCCSITIDSLG